MTARQWLHVVAGPNGGGKTTLAQQLFPGVPVINPDVIAAELSPGAPENAAFAAGRIALQDLRSQLERNETLGMETTLAGKWIFRFMEHARRRGYGIELLYIGLDSPSLAVQRVQERREAGGHGVPEADIRRRYRASLGHLPDALALADHALLYDNSAPPPAGPRVFGEVEQGIVVALEPEHPQWFRRAFAAEIRTGDRVPSELPRHEE